MIKKNHTDTNRKSNKLYVDKNDRVVLKGKTMGHVIDYLRYATSPLWMKKLPKAGKTFIKILKKLNVPEYLIPIKRKLVRKNPKKVYKKKKKREKKK